MTYELFRYNSILGIQKLVKAFQRLEEKKVPNLSKDYFIEGEIADLGDQRNLFDKEINSTKSPAPEHNKRKGKIMTKQTESGLLALDLLNKMKWRREKYIASLVQKPLDIYAVHERYIEYEFEMKKCQPKINDIFTQEVPKGRERDNEMATTNVFTESEVWSTLADLYKKNGYEEIDQLTEMDQERFKNDVMAVFTQHGMVKEEESKQFEKSKSMIGDPDFQKKKEKILNLRRDRPITIQKKSKTIYIMNELKYL